MKTNRVDIEINSPGYFKVDSEDRVGMGDLELLYQAYQEGIISVFVAEAMEVQDES